MLEMSKANVYYWIKSESIIESLSDCLEVMLFHLRKPNTETHKNMHILTIVSRNLRIIMGFDIAQDKLAKRIQQIMDFARTPADNT